MKNASDFEFLDKSHYKCRKLDKLDKKKEVILLTLKRQFEKIDIQIKIEQKTKSDLDISRPTIY